MATVTWLGLQRITRAVKPYTAAGTTSGSYGFTINGKLVSITGDGTTAAVQAASLQAALAASTEPEFKEIAWTVVGAIITATGPASGAPLTITVTVSGSATLTAGTATAPTSPNDAADGANYDTGALPANSDTLVYPANSADVRFNLNALSAITGLIVRVDAGGPAIGLPDWKSPGYREFRPTRLKASFASLTIDVGTRTGYFDLRFDLNGAATAVTILGQRSARAGQETVEIAKPGSTAAVSANGGSFAVTIGSGTSATLATVTAVNAVASVGPAITVTTLNYLNSSGIVESSFTTLNLNGGQVEVRRAATGTPVVDAGTLFWRSTGAIVSAVVGSGGRIDLSQGAGAVTVTNAMESLTPDPVIDPNKRLTRPYSINFTRCPIQINNVGEQLKVTIADHD